MPSTRPLLRPVLAALLTVTMLLAPALLAGAASPASAAAPASPAAPAAPSAPSEGGDSAVDLTLTSLDPTSLAPGGTLTARVRVTNTSEESLDAASLELRTRSSRVTDRAQLSQWEGLTGPDTAGEPVASSDPTVIAPGDSATLQIRVPAEGLGFSEESYLWGTRRISLTLSTSDGPQDAIRTFVVWRPEGASGSITESVLLPMTGTDPGAAAADPSAYADSAASGHLASLQALAAREDVDWWLDPQLLDPPRLAIAEEGDPQTTNGDAAAEYAVPETAQAIASTLQDAVGSRTVLAMPYARTDLAGLREGGATDLADAADALGRDTWQESGIVLRSRAVGIPGDEVTADALDQAAATGADTVIVPSTSVREDPGSAVTPSSIGTYEATGATGSGRDLRVLAPDPELSAEFASLDGSTDPELVTQRMLAETATIASEYSQAPRHLLISPDPEAALDAEAAGTALDALDEAPWLTRGTTDALLSAAEQDAVTANPSTPGDDLYALGAIDAATVAPSAESEDGTWTRTDPADVAATNVEPALARRLQDLWGELDTLGAVMEDDAALDGPRLEVLSAASEHWGSAAGSSARADLAESAVADLTGAISVVPTSGYNLISDSAGVPITVKNSLDTPITVRIAVTSDRPIVRVGEQPVVTVPARGQIDKTVPVEAIANGTVTLSVQLTSDPDAEDAPDGGAQALTSTSEVPLTVNPAWENWTTLLLVIGMGALVVVGVARARHTGSSHRAPAVHAPEDPVVLARTGRSEPTTEPLPPTADDADDAETHPDPTTETGDEAAAAAEDPEQKEERP